MSARTDLRNEYTPSWTSGRSPVDLIPPHASAKFAVLSGPDYHVVAVHALAPMDDLAYVSQQAPYGTAHGYRRPAWIRAADILMLCQTSDAAHIYRKQVIAEDRRADEEARRHA